MTRAVEEQRRCLVARQRGELLVLQRGAPFFGFEPAREQRQAHRDQHGDAK